MMFYKVVFFKRERVVYESGRRSVFVVSYVFVSDRLSGWCLVKKQKKERKRNENEKKR